MLPRSLLARRSLPALPARRLASTRQRPPPAPRLPAPTAADVGANIKFKTRTMAVTGAVALCVAVGAYTGARLKNDADEVQRREKVRALSPEEQIAMLQGRRAAFVEMRKPLERKLLELRERMAESEEGRGKGGP